MTSLILNTVAVVRHVLGNRQHRIAFAVLMIFIASLLFQLQVSVVPGNSVRMQIALYRVQDWLLLAAVSAMNALFIVVQWHASQLVGVRRRNFDGLASGGLGMSSSVLASFFGTATCGLCATALFGFLGTNAVLFLIAHRLAVTISAIAMLALSLMFVARRFTTSCAECRITMNV